jgi:hypothetical protein
VLRTLPAGVREVRLEAHAARGARDPAELRQQHPRARPATFRSHDHRDEVWLTLASQPGGLFDDRAFRHGCY